MGIVVSGEDGNLGISKERQKVNLIATENDYGLVMATLDQIFMFLGSWCTTSLGGRVQVRRSSDATIDAGLLIPVRDRRLKVILTFHC